jgi:hypothetical protein
MPSATFNSKVVLLVGPVGALVREVGFSTDSVHLAEPKKQAGEVGLIEMLSLNICQDTILRFSPVLPARCGDITIQWYMVRATDIKPFII